MPWDPPEDVMVRPITFFGGDYLVHTGGEAGRVFELESLIKAIFLGTWPRSADRFRQKCHELVLSTLALSDHILSTLGFDRYTKLPRGGGPLRMPSPAQFAAGRTVLCFTGAELAAAGFPSSSLATITHSLTSGRMPLLPDLAAFEATPIIERDGEFVVAAPQAFAVALRHALISTAIAHGVDADLAERLESVAQNEAARGAFHMQWEPAERGWRSAGGGVSSKLFDFDIDKACNLVLVSDQLAAYDVATPHSEWDVTALSGALDSALRGEAERIAIDRSDINELLHVVVLAGVGRGQVMGAPDPGPFGQVLVMFGEQFETITQAGNDPLDLWKHAVAGDRLRRTARLVSIDATAEFGVWLDHDRSFYIDDNGLSGRLVMMDGSHGRALRERLADERDLHGAPVPGRGWGVVTRAFDDPDIPIYLPWGAPMAGMLVELPAGPIWVVDETGAQPGGAAVAGAKVVIDCIAYWLWQMASGLPPTGALGDALVVAIKFDDPSMFVGTASADSGGAIATATVAGPARVELELHHDLVARLNRPDNLGERDLMAVLVDAVRTLNPTASAGLPAVADIVDSAAPLGIKKHINLFAPGSDPRAIRIAEPKMRLIHAPDSSDALDDLGRTAAAELGLGLGSVAASSRSSALNAAVETLWARFAATVASLNPDGLLEYLIGAHEALLADAAISERTVGAQLAVWGATQMADQYREDAPKFGLASTSLRLIIEYVIAKPPSGLRPMSKGVFDQLLALAGEIVSLGTASDAMHYRLDDGDVSILPSGRLGFDHDSGFRAGQQAFLRAISPVRARAAASRYTKNWVASGSGSPSPFAAELDRCAVIEWGTSMSDFMALYGALVSAGDRRGDGVATERLDVLIDELAKELEWTTAKVDAALLKMTLEPRSTPFLDPPAPHSRNDVSPWRFNRELSHLRRPVAIRTDAGGTEYAIWGFRHMYTARAYVLNLVLSSRYKASSSDMKTFMAKLRQEEADEFNERVATAYEDAGMLARRNVKRVKGVRISRPNGDHLTDIDVLAADTSNRTLYLAEAKNLEGARTPPELERELRKTFGATGNTAALRQVERVEWVEQRMTLVLDWLGISDDPTKWRVEGLMVTDEHVLTSHIASCPLPVMTLEELRAKLGV